LGGITSFRSAAAHLSDKRNYCDLGRAPKPKGYVAHDCRHAGHPARVVLERRNRKFHRDLLSVPCAAAVRRIGLRMDVVGRP
jgi:hypothetical protein